MNRIKIVAILSVLFFFSHQLSAQSLVGAHSILPTSQEELYELEQTAESGDIESQYRLGMALFYGGVADIDKEKAAQWLLKAAQQGHPLAFVSILQISSKEISAETKKEIDVWVEQYQKEQAVRHGLLPR